MNKIVSIDPGITNFAIWEGGITRDENTGNISVVTDHLEKVSLRTVGAGSIHEGAVKVILDTPWLMDAVRNNHHFVIETQEIHNILTRIVACTVYGVLRGIGAEVKFSGTAIKRNAMTVLAKQCGLTLEDKPQTKGQKSRKERMLNHRINKKNALLVARSILYRLGDLDTLAKVDGARDVRGKKKSDDMCDAILQGVGALLQDLN